jgi:hypothetical protein
MHADRSSRVALAFAPRPDQGGGTERSAAVHPVFEPVGPRLPRNTRHAGAGEGSKVCRLSAGGKRIRTCGPTPNGTAVVRAPGPSPSRPNLSCLQFPCRRPDWLSSRAFRMSGTGSSNPAPSSRELRLPGDFAFLRQEADRLVAPALPGHPVILTTPVSVMRPGPVPAVPCARTPGHGRKRCGPRSVPVPPTGQAKPASPPGRTCCAVGVARGGSDRSSKHLRRAPPHRHQAEAEVIDDPACART